MNAAPQPTKIFGMKVGVDPRLLVGVLLVLAIGLFIYNSRSESDSDAAHTDTTSVAATETPAQAPRLNRAGVRHNRQAAVDRGTLSIHPVDASRGDVDPRLRLDVLARLNQVTAGAGGRSLFEIGAAAPEPATLAAIQKLNKHIMPSAVPPPMHPVQTAITPAVNIPFKYYGFVKSAGGAQHNRGLFLQGDNVVVAAEGELIEKRYLIAELSPASARVEDTQMKQGQTLAVNQEAQEQ